MLAAVEHAATSMRTRYEEALTLHDLAAEVFVSPFHFSRVFSSTVGLTPGRYLTAVRLFEAKRRLLETDETVADIVCSVGYSSVGTFTSRFTRAVGLTPGQYRHPVVRAGLLAVASSFSRVPASDLVAHAATDGPGSAELAVGIRGTGGADRVLVGLFEGAVPQGRPLAMNLVEPDEHGTVLRGLPSGTWTVLAVAADADGSVRSAVERVEVRPQELIVPPVELELSAPGSMTAPLAVSLLDPTRGLPGPVPAVRHLRAVA